jgi:hypothetical protein
MSLVRQLDSKPGLKASATRYVRMMTGGMRSLWRIIGATHSLEEPPSYFGPTSRGFQATGIEANKMPAPGAQTPGRLAKRM